MLLPLVIILIYIVPPASYLNLECKDRHLTPAEGDERSQICTMDTFIVGAVCIFCLLYACFALKQRKQRLSSLSGPPGAPFIGNLYDLLRSDFHRVLNHWAEQYGGLYKIDLLGLQGVVVSDPSAIAQILGRVRGSSEIPKHTLSYKQLNLLWGDIDQYSIFTGHSTELWKTVRKALSPCFSPASIRYDSFVINLKTIRCSYIQFKAPRTNVFDHLKVTELRGVTEWMATQGHVCFSFGQGNRFGGCNRGQGWQRTYRRGRCWDALDTWCCCHGNCH